MLLCMLFVVFLFGFCSVHGVTAARTCPPIEKESCLAPSLSESLTLNRKFTYIEQHIVHCNANTSSSPECREFWSPKKKAFAFKLNHHYSLLSAKKNHSLFLMDKKLPVTAKPEAPRAFSLDIAVDARCHHSWPYNPYHRVADCLTFILPALYNFFNIEFIPKRPKFVYEKVKLALIVDESSEMLCEFLNKKTNFEGLSLDLSPFDKCLLHDFQELIRSRYYYQCIKVSIFSTSIYWYKYSNQVYVQTKEYIYLLGQKNPWASGSGFMNEVHYRYVDYLNEYRRLMLEGFCKYCQLPPMFPGHNIIGVNRKFPLGFANKQNLIVVLLRAPGSGRDFPQQKEFMMAIRKEIKQLNVGRGRGQTNHGWDLLNSSPQTHLPLQHQEQQHSALPLFHVVPYFGVNESSCETISLFWHAKVIIGAHGAGIVNTVYSRPNTLLIEITPDKLAASEKGVPWRMNAPFAHYMGLSSTVLVIPHNTSAKNDGELQKVYPLALSPAHIEFVATTMREYLTSVPNEHPQFKNITAML